MARFQLMLWINMNCWAQFNTNHPTFCSAAHGILDQQLRVSRLALTLTFRPFCFTKLYFRCSYLVRDQANQEESYPIINEMSNYNRNICWLLWLVNFMVLRSVWMIVRLRPLLLKSSSFKNDLIGNNLFIHETSITRDQR